MRWGKSGRISRMMRSAISLRSRATSWSMDDHSTTSVVAAFAIGCVVLVAVVATCCRVYKTAHTDRQGKLRIAFVVLAVGSVSALLHLAFGTDGGRLLKEVRHALEEFSADTVTLSVNGQEVSAPAALLRELQAIGEARHNHSPPRNAFVIDIAAEGHVPLSLLLQQDDARPDELWVRWPSRYKSMRLGTVKSSRCVQLLLPYATNTSRQSL